MDFKWFSDLLKQGGIISFFIFLACSMLVYLHTYFPKILVFELKIFQFIIIFGAISLALSLAHITKNVFVKLKKYYSQYKSFKEIKIRIKSLNSEDKKIIGYLIAKNLNYVDASYQNNSVKSLIDLGILEGLSKENSSSNTFIIPRNIWIFIIDNKDHFPYTPILLGEKEYKPWEIYNFKVDKHIAQRSSRNYFA